jgi:hypothetical protein
MTPAILTMLYRLGGLGGMMLISWQLLEHVPALEKSVAAVQSQQELVISQHEVFGARAEKFNDTSEKLLRGICLGMHKTQAAQQQFCNP